jgi:uncharacterized protein (TIGR00369 family)
MSRKVDPEAARARLETALETHEQAFESFFLSRFLGLEFAYLPEDAPDAEKEVCVVTLPLDEMVMNPQGSLHGGIMATAMDISMGHLIKKTADAGATIEMKIQFMRPVTGATARCEGRFTKRGRSISFLESRVFDENGKLAALATATWKMP